MSVPVRLRRIVALGAAATLVLVLGGCGRGDTGGDARKPVVLTTFTVLSDIASNVAGDHLTIESITKPGAEIHDYEPTTEDIRKATDADLILDNGLGLERWFERFVADLDVPHVNVSTGVTPIDITEDVEAGKPNPHAWMSPLNVQIYVDNLVTAFRELDPDHADDYVANADAYKQKLQELRDDLVERVSVLPPQQRALVTCEGAFSYLARDADLTERFIWPVNSENEATPQHVAGVIAFVKQNRVPAVFCESTVNDGGMRQVVDATGARFGGVLYVDSLSASDGPVPTYVDLIEYDSATIVAGLTGATP